MLFFEDTVSEQPRIEKAIKKYGYAPEHNFWWYQCQLDKKSKGVFAECEDGSGLLTIEERDKNKCFVFSSPIAPPSRRMEIILEYLDYIFLSKEIEKVTFEFESELYKEFTESLPGKFKARVVNYTLIWPVYNLNMFNPALSGNDWKSLRKTRNKFYQKHSIAVFSAENYGGDKEELLSIIDEWRKRRGGNDRSHHHPYKNFIENNFKGAKEARILTVDGKACGINAGWIIPNSNRFYGAMGIHNYRFPELGDALYLEDLAWLKEHGYKEADMGGGEEALNNFKNKFHPESFYKTHIFSVVKS